MASLLWWIGFNGRGGMPRAIAHATRVLVLLLLAGPVAAQVPRSIGNTGFEEPALSDQWGDCYAQLGSQQVPSWRTSHPMALGTNTCGDPPSERGPLIELWQYPGAAREGRQFAEINASANSRLSQPLCLATGEQVRWQLSHRARTGTDTMSVNINGTTNEIMRASTTTLGNGTVLSCGGGAVGDATCRQVAVTGAWADYAGVFTWTGPTGVQTLGFQSISTGTGNLAVGNFLDRIQVFVQPYVEFSTTSLSASEASGTVEVALRISGTLEFDLNIGIEVDTATSTATRGVDFDTPNGADVFVVQVPAGEYGGGTDIPITLTVADDREMEDGEVIALRVLPSDQYAVASTTTCGAAPAGMVQVLLSSDDVWVAVEKRELPGAKPGTAEFEVVYRNRSPVPSVGDPAAHDALVTIADDLAAGYADYAWTCEPEGAPSTTCAQASGTGAFYQTVLIPPASALRFRIVGTFDGAACRARNDAWLYMAWPDREATSVDARLAGVGTPVGDADNAASAGPWQRCADVSLTKTNTPGLNGDVDLDDDALVANTTTQYTLVVSNRGPDPADGVIVTDPAVPGLSCVSATCAAIGDAACPAATGASLLAELQGSGAVIPALAVESSVRIDVTCEVEAVP